MCTVCVLIQVYTCTGYHCIHRFTIVQNFMRVCLYMHCSKYRQTDLCLYSRLTHAIVCFCAVCESVGLCVDVPLNSEHSETSHTTVRYLNLLLCHLLSSCCEEKSR